MRRNMREISAPISASSGIISIAAPLIRQPRRPCASAARRA
jgi:hypothetical protein